MKKLVFAAIAAIAMVSASNVFANITTASTAAYGPNDTTAVDTVAPEQQTEPAEPTDTAASLNDSTDDTAMLMFSDSTVTDSASVLGSDSSAVAML